MIAPPSRNARTPATRVTTAFSGVRRMNPIVLLYATHEPNEPHEPDEPDEPRDELDKPTNQRTNEPTNPRTHEPAVRTYEPTSVQ